MNKKILAVRTCELTPINLEEKSTFLAQKINGQMVTVSNSIDRKCLLDARSSWDMLKEKWIVRVNLEYKENRYQVLTFRVTAGGIENFDIGMPKVLKNKKVCSSLLTRMNGIFVKGEKISMSILDSTTRRQMYDELLISNNNLVLWNKPFVILDEPALSKIFSKTLMGHLLGKMGLKNFTFAHPYNHKLTGIDAMKNIWVNSIENEVQGEVFNITKKFEIAANKE